MSRKRSIWLGVVAIAVVAGVGVFGASASPPGGTDASEVTNWNRIATMNLGAIPGPNGGAPPAFQINMGMVQGAVYDAVNAIGPKQHGHICSTSAQVRRRPSTPLSQRLPTT